MSIALFELDDFEETKPSGPIYQMFECGIHRQNWDWEEHLAGCMNGECPACGQKMTHWYDFHVNHGAMRWPAWDERLCSKQHILMNHCISNSRALDGEWVSTNCHARSHRHKNGGYSKKGMPPECAAAELIEKTAWLTSHRVPIELIASPRTALGKAVVDAARPSVDAWLAKEKDMAA